MPNDNVGWHYLHRRAIPSTSLTKRTVFKFHSFGAHKPPPAASGMVLPPLFLAVNNGAFENRKRTCALGTIFSQVAGVLVISSFSVQYTDARTLCVHPAVLFSGLFMILTHRPIVYAAVSAYLSQFEAVMQYLRYLMVCLLGELQPMNGLSLPESPLLFYGCVPVVYFTVRFLQKQRSTSSLLPDLTSVRALSISFKFSVSERFSMEFCSLSWVYNWRHWDGYIVVSR